MWPRINLLLFPPQIEEYYDISYTIVSLIFLSGFVGYVLAALVNNLVHHHLGQVGAATLGPVGRLIGYIAIACHPPFPVLPVVLLFPGFGNGVEESSWNAWIGNMQNSNELLGILHGAYGLGATIAPLIATAMVTKADLAWYVYYYVLVGIAGLEGLLSVAAFWGATGRVHRATYQRDSTTGAATRTTTREALREPVTWLLAIFLLMYVGAEVSLGGWITTFMLDVRHADSFPAGMAVTGFWLGLTVGRLVLGFLTGRIGEKVAITLYLLVSIGLLLLYWLVPNFLASAIVVAFLGFALGPFFPAVVVTAAKLLPPSQHVSAIGFAAAFGSAGSAIFPFVVGAISQARGVEVLPPIILAMLGVLCILWFLVPGGAHRGGLERARENHEKIGHDVVTVYRRLRGRLIPCPTPRPAAPAPPPAGSDKTPASPAAAR